VAVVQRQGSSRRAVLVGLGLFGTDLGTHDSVEVAMQVAEDRWDGRACCGASCGPPLPRALTALRRGVGIQVMADGADRQICAVKRFEVASPWAHSTSVRTTMITKTL
jgi:hypothetical protein